MLHATRAVDVAMGFLFCAGIAHLGNFNVEGQHLPGQRMVGVYVNVESAHLDYGDLHRPLAGLQTDHLAGFQASWSVLNPGFEIFLWTDRSLAEFIGQRALRRR